MIAIILDTFREAIYRKVFLMMIVACVLFGIFEIYHVGFETDTKTGELVVRYHGYKNTFPAEWMINNELTELNVISQGPCLFFSFFLVAPLLSTYLEKGAIELSFTKGTSRRNI